MVHEDDGIEFFASCIAGFEPQLALELKRIGVRRVRPLKGGVAFFGEPLDGERVCLWSRVASRVMAVVGRVNAGDADLLYAGIYALPWESVLVPGASIAVRASGVNDELRNTQFTSLKVKDALCDRVRERTGARPNVDAHRPDIAVDVRIRGNRATVSLDLAGESLYHRAYLDEHDGADAPLLCAYAAGLLVAAGAYERLREGWGVLDPASDAGFIVCEAADMAADAAPGLLRERWGFLGWAAHDAEAWDDELARADERFEAGVTRLLAGSSSKSANDMPDTSHVRIVGVSASSPAISTARGHLRRAGLRAVASVEAAAADDAAAVEERLAGIAARGVSDGGGSGDREADGAPQPALIVANVVPVDRAEDARAVSEAASFMGAVRRAPAGSVFAVISPRSFEGRFGARASESAKVGVGRIESYREVYNQAPPDLASIVIPDSQGGSDHVVEVNDAAAAQFAARLRKVARERRKWARREEVSCYRIYDADLPEYNVAIDLYAGAGDSLGKTYVHVAEYQAPSSVDPGVARARLDDALAVIPVALGVRPDHVFSKVRSHSKGGSQYRSEARRSYVTRVEEDGLLFEVDLSGYLDTGLFLDHRLTRREIEYRADGARFLNLFAYTGVATVHAAAGGAVSTTTVDLSQTYLEWARRNMELNGYACEEVVSGSDAAGAGSDGAVVSSAAGSAHSAGSRRADAGASRGKARASQRSPHRFVRADVMSWIREARRRREEYDLIFVDPPTFSNSKSMGRRTWDVQRDHVELLIGVSRLLSRDGMALFSCNLRSFKPDFEQLERYGVQLEDVSAQSIPHDFERNPRIHQCYVLTRA